MPLRLLEATVPREALDQVQTLVQDARIVHLRTSESSGATGLVSILVDAEDTEVVSDLLVSHFGSHDAFRLILLPVEATLPAVSLPSDSRSGDEQVSEPPTVGARRISREELYQDLEQASRLTSTYLVTVALSTVVAAVGVIRGDVAIIIGAMVIAPLLGPNVGLSLAAALGDADLARRSLKAIGAGVALVAALSLLLGVVLPVDPSAQEIAVRTRPDIGDIALALAAGTAGALAFTSGVPAVVVGVMVAVALLPPLVVAGLLAGAGYGSPATGAMVLVLTNVTCVNLAAVATFFFQKVRPRTWWEADRAKRATRLAATAWIVMLGVLLALIALGYVGAV